MASFNINEMKANLRYGGARPTLFKVQLNNPVDSSVDLRAPFFIQAASLPMWQVGRIDIPYMGRRLPTPGDREFEPWNIEVINDEDFALRNAIEAWNNSLNTLEGNRRDAPSSSSTHYESIASVTQLSKTGEELRTYEFINLWPAMVGQIQLAWSAQNQIEVFPVTFMYDSFRVVNGPTGDAGGTG